MERGIARSIQWYDARFMAADGHTKGGIDRDMLFQVMGGIQAVKHDLKSHAPYRAGQTSSSDAA
eukprot:3012495-Pyramimonas_sp.AAC.1